MRPTSPCCSPRDSRRNRPPCPTFLPPRRPDYRTDPNPTQGPSQLGTRPCQAVRCEGGKQTLHSGANAAGGGCETITAGKFGRGGREAGSKCAARPANARTQRNPSTHAKHETHQCNLCRRRWTHRRLRAGFCPLRRARKPLRPHARLLRKVWLHAYTQGIHVEGISEGDMGSTGRPRGDNRVVWRL